MSDITKIVLNAGQIESQQQLTIAELDPILFARAQEALAELRSGTRFVSHLLEDTPEMAVGLGLMDWPEWVEERMRKDWLKHCPDKDIADYEVRCKESREYHQRTQFFLTIEGSSIFDGVTDFYNLIPPVLPKSYRSIIAMAVDGSYPHSCSLHHEDPNKESRWKYCNYFAGKLLKLKPAFLAPSTCLDSRSKFGDHFAVAMLLEQD